MKKLRKRISPIEDFVPTEYQDQCALIEWFRRQYPDPSNLIFANGNGGSRSAKTRVAKNGKKVRVSHEVARLKRAGMVNGIPDLFLAVPKGIYHGMFIEMKRNSMSARISPSQQYIQFILSRHYKVVTCLGFEEAAREVRAYMDLL